MATTKRAYKLQEFIAHSSNVNCLKIGRRTSRILVTGGEDHMVNIWAIGKPNAILSLTGHISAVESVSFDSPEVLVAAGAASGSIKLWDLEEAKIIRTLPGHRSNCISVDFHPFGEFFASGSLDTNLKIWDIRTKGCIRTYKGHTRGVNAIKFTPDGRWVVSGGEDNIVKLWDLTAGKLLRDFKFHESQIQCIDFHPHEFLLATGSADKTIKFWDLETFELIGSAGPEASGVRSMIFNPDGRTLLCGLHESLKVFSWEPIRCHDAVDVGWTRISDMNVHEEKLLGCSYNQSCVGVWVVNLSLIGPYVVASSTRLNDHSELQSTSIGISSMQADNNIKTATGRLLQNSDSIAKETEHVASTVSVPGAGTESTMMTPASVSTTVKRSSSKTQFTTNLQNTNKSDIAPVIVPKTHTAVDQRFESTKNTGIGKTISYDIQSKLTDILKISNTREISDKADIAIHSEFISRLSTERNEHFDRSAFSPGNAVVTQQMTAGGQNLDDCRQVTRGRARSHSFRESTANYGQEIYNNRSHKPKEGFSGVSQGERPRSLVANWERRENSHSCDRPLSSSSSESIATSSYSLRYSRQFAETESVAASDENSIATVLKNHDLFLSITKSRLNKLQVVHRLWKRNDVKGVINAIEKMPDHAVSVDVLSSLNDRSDIITLDMCTSLLPLLNSLLESRMDRHLSVSLDMLLKLVRIFGHVIRSTLSAGPFVAADLQAEQRLENCNLCFIELEKVKHSISSLTRSLRYILFYFSFNRRGGSLAKVAQELNLALLEFFD